MVVCSCCRKRWKGFFDTYQKGGTSDNFFMNWLVAESLSNGVMNVLVKVLKGSGIISSPPISFFNFMGLFYGIFDLANVASRQTLYSLFSTIH